MSELRVPKNMLAEEVIWAFRHGVSQAIWMRERRIVPSFEGYTNHYRNVMALADRVRMEWMRRHPAPTTHPTTENE
jgi:hypothetical protein